MDTEPMNFRGTYPLAGEKIGPAWREAWQELSLTRWTEGAQLADLVARRCGVDPKTVYGLLWRAERAGQIEKRVRRFGAPLRKRVEYRVTR